MEIISLHRDIYTVIIEKLFQSHCTIKEFIIDLINLHYGTKDFDLYEYIDTYGYQKVYAFENYIKTIERLADGIIVYSISGAIDYNVDSEIFIPIRNEITVPTDLDDIDAMLYPYRYNKECFLKVLDKVRYMFPTTPLELHIETHDYLPVHATLAPGDHVVVFQYRYTRYTLDLNKFRMDTNMDHYVNCFTSIKIKMPIPTKY